MDMRAGIPRTEGVRVRDVAAYCELMGVHHPAQRRSLLQYTHVMNSIWVPHFQKKDFPAAKTPPQQPATRRIR